MMAGQRAGLKPEPIAIPVAAAPARDIQLSLPGSSDQPPTVPAPDFDQLREALGHSEIQHGQLQVLQNIGHGSSGVVQKVLHMPSSSVLALKVIPVDADEAVLKSILLELKTLHDSRHPSIVSFYGAYYREGAVHIALEYMDASLLDITRAEGGPLSEQVLAAITAPVINGMVYLHRQLHLIHRDIKPSNILVDTAGNIKIADFGVSGDLAHTLAKCASWVGTVHYMSPERISGGSYSYDSDVWSLGITLLELAIAVFPYLQSAPSRPHKLSFWDLLDFIVESPPPTPPSHFSAHFHSFITSCLQKLPEARVSSTELLTHPFLLEHAAHPIDVASWIQATLHKIPPRNTEGEVPDDGMDEGVTLQHGRQDVTQDMPMGMQDVPMGMQDTTLDGTAHQLQPVSSFTPSWMQG
uniref:mitogen-activated protein kinase kinase n=1 Tax=Haptolina ericina TaxID=156174 RepID=A0A7S3BTS6_9EUKA|mmetsp:Transcript_67773/g.151325  ORF Transcript_67773/g.151325 Transcript_67773/m.151325 type:complete len:411 (+) Transcript_67773:93-1325(+)